MATKIFRRVHADALELEVLQLSTGYELDDADGVFRAAPADNRIDMTSHAANTYLRQKSEARAAWTEDYYIAFYYSQGAAVPVWSEEISVKDDAITDRRQIVSRDKIFRRVYETALEMEIIDLLASPTVKLDNDDLAFRETPGTDRIPLTSHSANQYLRQKDLSATVFPTSLYAVLYYEQGGLVPVDSDIVAVAGDRIVPSSYAYLVTSTATPVRSLIIAALAARLATILIANGYRTNLGSDVAEWDEEPLDPNKSTLQVQYRDDTEERVQETVGEEEMTLDATIRIRTTQALPISVMRQCVADVVTALYADRSFGGLADDIQPDGAVKMDKGQKSDTAVGAEMKFKIFYNVNIGES